ncbi:hypothetical protein ASC90_26905 [Rhizobium sp. Root1220]|nr:hypothetical protein ASC90_26905 [Rhizobium sp. Root1220]
MTQSGAQGIAFDQLGAGEIRGFCLGTDEGNDLVSLCDGLADDQPAGGTCPSSNELRLFGLWKSGVSGSVCGLI